MIINWSTFGSHRQVFYIYRCSGMWLFRTCCQKPWKNHWKVFIFIKAEGHMLAVLLKMNTFTVFFKNLKHKCSTSFFFCLGFLSNMNNLLDRRGRDRGRGPSLFLFSNFTHSQRCRYFFVDLHLPNYWSIKIYLPLETTIFWVKKPLSPQINVVRKVSGFW